MAYNYAYRGFPPPNTPRMMIPPPNLHAPPRFNNNSPWNQPPPPSMMPPPPPPPPSMMPPQSMMPPPPPSEQSQYNIYNFMQPPHVMQRPSFPPSNVYPRGPSPFSQRQQFTPDNIFTQEASSGPRENFPFNNGPGFQNNGQHFQGHRGRGRGFMGGRSRGHGFRGGFRGGMHNGNQNTHNGNQNTHNGNQNTHNGNQNSFNKTKKEKVDKRDLPENNAYFCDICDRGFKTEEKYQEHVNEHIKCSFKDCPFIGAPKLVQLHARMQHSSGLAKKVWHVKSAEDINKWREERKKNYPTNDNVAKKKQEKDDRIARGEILHTKEFGKMWQGRGRGGNRRNGGRGRGRGRGRGKWRDYDNAERNDDFPQADDGSDSEGPPEETGIKKSTADEDNLSESGVACKVDADAPASEPQALVPAGESNKLIQALSVYGESSPGSQSSDDKREQSPVDSDTKPATQSATSPSKLVSPQKSTETPSVNGVSSSCTTPPVDPQNQVTSPESDQPAVNGNCSSSPHKPSPASSPNISLEELPEPSPSSVSGQHQKHTNQSRGHKEKQGNKRAAGSEQENGPPHKQKKKGQTRPTVHRYTLLEKMLAPDMRRERNKVLQCAHYIVKNKFFESEAAARTVV